MDDGNEIKLGKSKDKEKKREKRKAEGEKLKMMKEIHCCYMRTIGGAEEKIALSLWASAERCGVETHPIQSFLTHWCEQQCWRQRTRRQRQEVKRRKQKGRREKTGKERKKERRKKGKNEGRWSVFPCWASLFLQWSISIAIEDQMRKRMNGWIEWLTFFLSLRECVCVCVHEEQEKYGNHETKEWRDGWISF